MRYDSPDTFAAPSRPHPVRTPPTLLPTRRSACAPTLLPGPEERRLQHALDLSAPLARLAARGGIVRRLLEKTAAGVRPGHPAGPRPDRFILRQLPLRR